MSSIVEISNIALIELGGEPISSLTETTPQATAINAVWDQCRRAVLRSHAWNFATKTEHLPALATNTRKFRFDFAYQIPSDSIRLLTVYGDREYRLEGNVIYTNKESCKIKYIFDNKSIASWDSLFVDTMSAKVQSKIAMTITRDADTARFAESVYQMRLVTAQAVDATEDIEDPIMEPDSEIISGRF